MPPKAITLGGAAAVPSIPHVSSSETSSEAITLCGAAGAPTIHHVSSSEVSFKSPLASDISSPPPISCMEAEKRRLPSTIHASPSPKKVSAVGFDSPKRYVMKIVNVSIGEWMERCPEQSVSGATGTGSTYAVVLCEMATMHVTTKREMKQVPKKNIMIGDDTGKTAELVVWGAFACRAWM
jgi:hypothetical protein